MRLPRTSLRMGMKKPVWRERLRSLQTLQPSTLTILLTDTSQEYDPYGKKDPDNLDKPISERPIGGLGVFLAVRGVDDFHYEYTDGQNFHTFVVNIPPDQTGLGE